MTNENLLTHYAFVFASGDVRPSTWPLAAFIPGGALRASHVEYRVGTGAWAPVAAWDQATKTATQAVPADAARVEFRRRTPRYSLLADPQRSDSRFTQAELLDCATQALFVAIEWAADTGIDAYSKLVAGSDGPNKLGLKQDTQNHWAADFPFRTERVYNFKFAGGYISRAHVVVQIKVDGVWTLFPITADDFFGPYTLRLDFSSVVGEITGLVIHRHTPRNVTVPVPVDHEQVTPAGMEPSARHAFFVAVEIGEELAKFAPTLPVLDTLEKHRSFLLKFSETPGSFNSGALPIDRSFRNPLRAPQAFSEATASFFISAAQRGGSMLANDAASKWLVYNDAAQPFIEDINGPWAVEMWVLLDSMGYWATHAVDYRFIGQATDGTVSDTIWTFGTQWDAPAPLDLRNYLTFDYGPFGSRVSIQTNINVPKNVWTHIAIVRRPGTISFYLNGVRQETHPLGTLPSSAGKPLFVGGSPAYVGTRSIRNQYIDDVSVVADMDPTNGTDTYPIALGGEIPLI